MNARRSNRVAGGLDVIRPEPFNQQIGCEVAADRDHRVAQLAIRHRAADFLVNLSVGIVANAQRIRTAIDDAVELVLDRQLIVQLDSPGANLLEQLDHHRYLHGARRVVFDVWPVKQFGAAVQHPERDAGVRPRLVDQFLDFLPCGRETVGFSGGQRQRDHGRKQKSHGGDSMACCCDEASSTDGITRRRPGLRRLLSNDHHRSPEWRR